MSEIVGRTLKGTTKSVLVDHEAITISYRALYHGFKGDKRIPYKSMTAVQFMEPGSWLAGYIQFSIKGAVEPQYTGSAHRDENAIQFDDKDLPDFVALRDFVQSRIEATERPIAAFSVADELAKLADLRDKGLLTEVEFAAQKIRILGS